MTKLLYQTDSYLMETPAEIQVVDEDNQRVILDQTIFFPGGGGQQIDTGSLSIGDKTFPVLRAQKGPEGIWHILDTPGGETSRNWITSNAQSKLGETVPEYAHTYCHAYPVRGNFQGFRRPGNRWGYGTAKRPYGF